MRIERAQANREAYGVGLNVGEMILSTGQMNGIAVDGEDISGDVLARTHRLQRGGVGRGDSSELCVTAAVTSRWSNGRYHKVVDHPAFIPARFIVDDE